MAKNKYTREDVLKGIEYCVDCGGKCYECPFDREGFNASIECVNDMLTETRKLLLKKPKNEAPVKLGQKVWILIGTHICRLPVLAISKDGFILELKPIFGYHYLEEYLFDEIGVEWFTKLTDAKKCLKNKLEVNADERIAFKKITEDCYSSVKITKI